MRTQEEYDEGHIPGAELRMYEQWGHGLYEEARDFNQVVKDFLTMQMPPEIRLP